MASAVDRIVSAREGTGALDRAIEAVVGTIGRFSGKDATSYLASYRAEMVMRDIPEERRLAGFPRVAMSGIHAEVLKVRAKCRTLEEFEGWLLESTGLMTHFGYQSGTSWSGWRHPKMGEMRRCSSGSLRDALHRSRHSTGPY